MKSFYNNGIDRIVKSDVSEIEECFCADSIQKYWLAKINETLKTAVKSRFYRELLGDKPLRLQSMEQFAGLPFTSSRDIIAHGHEKFWTDSLDKMSRIVTLRTSGSTGSPKRICFTDEDIAGTMRFFAAGMGMLTRPDTRALIFMPGSAENGVSDLLAKALAEIGVEAVHYGLITDFEDAARAASSFKPHCIIGVPLQILRLSYSLGHTAGIKTALLSSDSLPEPARKRIETNLECKVFNHYGSTEMGYGAALECGCHDGMHLRESELYFEVVEPETGNPVPDGEFGELVFTTLKRSGMPLIRYRTGDAAKIMSGPCPCGSVLRSISAPERISPHKIIISGKSVTLDRLDEALLAFDDIADFLATWRSGRLIVKLWTISGRRVNEPELRESLARLFPVDSHNVRFQLAQANEPSPCQTGKRAIVFG